MQSHNKTQQFNKIYHKSYYTPLFSSCKLLYSLDNYNQSKLFKQDNSIIFDSKQSIKYLAFETNDMVNSKIFKQCPYLCNLATDQEENQAYIFIEGQNLWDFLRKHKLNDIILCQEQLQILFEQIVQALLQLRKYGFQHNNLKQYSIQRIQPKYYQLIYHPSMTHQIQMARKNLWYDYYLAPEQLQYYFNTKTRNVGVKDQSKSIVFRLGCIILNLMNPEDEHRKIYRRDEYKINQKILKEKIKNAGKVYSAEFLNVVKYCLAINYQQRIALQQIKDALNNAKHCILKRKKHFMSRFNTIIYGTQTSFYKCSNQNYKSISNQKIELRNKNKQQLIQSFMAKPFTLNQDEQQFLHKENCPNPYNQNNSARITFHRGTFGKTDENYCNKSNITQVKDYLKDQRGKNNQFKDIIEIKDFRNQQNQQNQINYYDNQIYSPKFKQIDNQNNFYKEQQLNKINNKKQNKQQQNQIYFKQSIQINKKILSNNISNFDQKKKNLHSKKVQYSLKQFQNKNKNKNNSYYKSPSKSQKIYHQSEQSTQPYNSKETTNYRNFLSGNVQSNYQSPQNHIPQSHFSDTHVQQLCTTEQIINYLELLNKQYYSLPLLKNVQLSVCLQGVNLLKQRIGQLGVWINGDIYFGNFNEGRRCGLSLQIFPNQQYYYGEFSTDLFHGQGFYCWSQSEYFLGWFRNGQKQYGQFWNSKIHYQGYFQHNSMHKYGKCYYLHSGSSYEGQWFKGKRHGYGSLLQTTGDIFIGQWFNGKKYGKGQYITSQCVITGEWKNDQVIDKVRIKYKDKSQYFGGFFNYKKSGYGQVFFASGSIFKGEFHQDEANKGQIEYVNGDKYTGQVKNMKRHGYGTYIYKIKGKSWSGYWKNGQPQQQSSQLQK